MGAVSGDINTLSLSVDTAADLSSRPTAALKSGDRAYITSKIGTTEGPLFFIDKSSVLAVDGVGVLATNSGVGRWLSEALYGGVEAPISVANAAALAAVPSASFDEGMLAWVETFRSYFRLDPASALAADGKTVIAASGGGRWLRDPSYRDYTWSVQATWFIDPVNGDDENDGSTSDAALATWAEFVRRVMTVSVSMTVIVTGNIAESLIGRFQPSVAGLTFTLQGLPTELVTGTIGVVTNPDPATNAEGTLTSAAVADWTPYVGRIVECTSGAAATSQTVVLANVAGVAQTPAWARRSSFTNPTPAPGDAIRVLQMPTAPSILLSTDTMGIIVRYFDIATATASSLVASLSPLPVWEACELGSLRIEAICGVNFVGCAFKVGGSHFVRTYATILGGASFRSWIIATGLVAFTGHIIYGNQLMVGNTADNMSASYVTVSGAYGLGIFNVAGNALDVNGGGRIGASGRVYGDGNTVGCAVSDGGVIQKGEAVTFTITGVTELQVDGAANQMPPLTPGAAVPAVAPLTTWAQWAAAPFSRSYIGMTTGSSGTRISGI